MCIDEAVYVALWLCMCVFDFRSHGSALSTFSRNSSLMALEAWLEGTLVQWRIVSGKNECL